MTERRRITRRLVTFAVAGALAFGGGFAVAQAWPDDDTPSEQHDDGEQHDGMDHDD